jgi:hypothetical protein
MHPSMRVRVEGKEGGGDARVCVCARARARARFDTESSVTGAMTD